MAHSTRDSVLALDIPAPGGSGHFASERQNLHPAAAALVFLNIPVAMPVPPSIFSLLAAIVYR